MRLNKFIALATGMGRRPADLVISNGRVRVNGQAAQAGQDVRVSDQVTLDGKRVAIAQSTTTIMLNKPVGYVVSRNGQGSRTIYELLPAAYHTLKPVGRLDKESSGLLLLTDDGQLAHELTHPSRLKMKLYHVTLDKPLLPLHHQMISDYGIMLDDGPSKFQLDRLNRDTDTSWSVSMHEGRNRQIRRTFAALGYSVAKLHRIQFGPYSLGAVPIGQYEVIRAAARQLEA